MQLPSENKIKVLSHFENEFYANRLQSHIDDLLNVKFSKTQNENFIFSIIDLDIYIPKNKESFFDKISFTNVKRYMDNQISFESIMQDLFSKNYNYKSFYPHIRRVSYYMRFSKLYGTMEFYSTTTIISKNKKNNFFVKNIKQKFFKITLNDKVLIYLKANIIRYISYKNIKHLYPIVDTFRLLLINIHTQCNYGDEFIDYFYSYQIPNKHLIGTSSLTEIIYKSNSSYELIFKENPDLKKYTTKHFNKFMLVGILFTNIDLINFVEFYKSHLSLYFRIRKLDNCDYIWIRKLSFFDNFIFFYILYINQIFDIKNDTIHYNLLKINFINVWEDYFICHRNDCQKMKIKYKTENQFKYNIYKYYTLVMIKNNNIRTEGFLKFNSNSLKFIKFNSNYNIIRYTPIQTINLLTKLNLEYYYQPLSILFNLKIDNENYVIIITLNNTRNLTTYSFNVFNEKGIKISEISKSVLYFIEYITRNISNVKKRKNKKLPEEDTQSAIYTLEAWDDGLPF